MSETGSLANLEDAFFRLGPLRGVPPEALRGLLAITTLVTFPAERCLFLQGDPLSEHAWLLVTGRLSVLVTSGGQQRVMADVWPGEIVGEAALYARGRARSATVMTVGPSVVLRIPRSALLESENQPALIALELHLLETMAKRLRSTNVVLQRVITEQRHVRSTAAATLTSNADRAHASATRHPAHEAPRPTLAQRLARWFHTTD
ncbi:MAG: cyclic nucleotide-binding domain-containing protein [Pseudomonadota bacterium]|nr:cyclic nucleotide-binding domain-containing protein [Pseudomonadota bacterium]